MAISASLLPARRRRGLPCPDGFTLIELLTVLAIIGVLAAISFNVAGGVRERAAIGKAKAELAAVAVALESYKRQYGDFPQTGEFPQAAVATDAAIQVLSAQSKLFNALSGNLRADLAPFTTKAKSYLDSEKFTLEDPSARPDLDLPTEVANSLLDPWERRYQYYYKRVDRLSTGRKRYDWTESTYVLYSAGPDGRAVGPDITGRVDYDHPDNLDNIYANR